jgi:putative oxidoreductase
MATVSHPNSHVTFDLSSTKAGSWVVPVGRTLFGMIFVLSGINHFSANMIAFGASQGVPMAEFLVPASGALALIGGLSIIFGYFTRFGAVLLIAFLVPVTLSMHAFWNITDPTMHQMQMIQFMKNLSMLGGAILIAYYGAGPKGLDSKRSGSNVL